MSFHPRPSRPYSFGRSTTDGPNQGKHPTVLLYIGILAVLMVLLVITLVAAAIDLGPLNLPIAMAIAVIKMLFVVLFFMHVFYSSKLVWVFAGSAFFWLLIMFTFSFSDYISRPWFTVPHM
jgi:cytochrome c oxidase subunit IV